MDITMSIIQIACIIAAFLIYRSNKTKFSLLILSYFLLWPPVEYLASIYSTSGSVIPELFAGLAFAASYLAVICEKFHEKFKSAIALLAHVVYSFLFIASSSAVFVPYTGKYEAYEAGYFVFTLIVGLVLLFEARNVRDHSRSSVSSRVDKMYNTSDHHAK